MEPDDLTIDPGSQATTKVTVRNIGTRVEEFELVIQGPGADFATVTPPTVSVYPDVEQRAVVRFAPLRGPQSPAGVSTFEVVARSVVHSDVRDVTRGRLTVTAFEDLQAVLKPDASRGRKAARHLVSVTNGGNTPVNSQVAFTDQDKVLTFEPRDTAVMLQPGGTAELPVLLNGPRRWFGRTERLPFAAVVTPAGTQPPITLNGTRQQTPVFPWWMPPAALVILALAIGLAALIKSLVGPPTVPGIGLVSQAAAEKVLTAKDYIPDPIMQGSDKVPKGQAINTDPAAGQPLKKHEHVKLFISSGPCGEGPCPVPVPIVEGLPVSEAQARLEEKGFAVQLNPVASDTVPRDRVVSSKPEATTMRPPNTPVQLTVSTGAPHNPAEQAAADKAATEKAAADKATADKAATEKAAADKTAADKAAADKDAAAKDAAGKVPVPVPVPVPASPKVVPDLTARSVEDATKALTDLGLKAKTAPEPVHSNAVPDGKVLSSAPKKADKVEAGSEVTLTVAQNTARVNLIDIADNAEKTAWTAMGGTTETLTFGGTPGTTTGGLVKKRAGSLASGKGTLDTTKVTTVLETHPPDSRGLITGEYKLEPSVVPGDHVKALVGLVKPSDMTPNTTEANTNNEITFSVEANGQPIKSVTAKPDTPQELDADLSKAVGVKSIKIVVTSSGKQNPTLTPVWQGLRLEPKVGK